MRRILICSGVLGGGTALTFVAAAIASALAPTGPLVYSQGQSWARPMPAIGIPAPAPNWGVDLPAKGDADWGEGSDGGGTDGGTIDFPDVPADVAPGG